MKSPIRRRVAVAALLLAPALTACGFSAQTDQVYQAAVGVNDRSGQVDVLNALVVSGQDGYGTFAATLVNTSTTEDDVLESVTGSGITASQRTVAVPAGDNVPLADSGVVTLQGADIAPGKFVELTLDFADGHSVTIKVPVVEAGGDYANVPLPRPSATATSSSE